MAIEKNIYHGINVIDFSKIEKEENNNDSAVHQVISLMDGDEYYYQNMSEKLNNLPDVIISVLGNSTISKLSKKQIKQALIKRNVKFGTVKFNDSIELLEYVNKIFSVKIGKQYYIQLVEA